MPSIPKEEQRRVLPTEELQKKLKKYIGDITPYEAALERILTEWGFSLPGWDKFDGETYFGFYDSSGEKAITVLRLNYADALAEEILYLCENEIIKPTKP
jgi:hypothetical protein